MAKENDVSLFKHKISLKVRFSDLDAMRHVNNAAYLSYLEEGRIAYFNSVLKAPKNSLAFGAVVARVEIDYLNPIELGDDVEILTRVVSFGNKSSVVNHAIMIRRGDASIPAAFAVTKLVSFDYKSKKTVPIPENIKEIIMKFEAGDE
ncbi:MAG: acyl-CoA thioesterase [Chlorobi bacterium]|nr:acyl-CoA thioesterase [Chlorobiota bacterium]